MYKFGVLLSSGVHNVVFRVRDTIKVLKKYIAIRSTLSKIVLVKKMKEIVLNLIIVYLCMQLDDNI